MMVLLQLVAAAAAGVAVAGVSGYVATSWDTALAELLARWLPSWGRGRKSNIGKTERKFITIGALDESLRLQCREALKPR